MQPIGKGRSANFSGEQEFKLLAETYCQYCRELGIEVFPYADQNLPNYRVLLPSSQEQALNTLRNLVSAAAEVKGDGLSLNSSNRLVWYGLRKLHLVPPSDGMMHIGEKDIVTVYGPRHELLFWNFEYFRFVSFTVEQVLCTNWGVIRRRDPETVSALTRMAVDMEKRVYRESFDPQVPEHIAEEVNSPRNLRLLVHLKRGIPLTLDGAFGGYIVVSTAKPVNP